MNGKAVYTIVPPAPPERAVQDEWGMFDPNQAGLQAAFRAVRELNTPVLDSISVDEPYLPTAAAGSDAASDASVPDADNNDIELESAIANMSPNEHVYDLTGSERPRRAKHPDRGAVYTLEFPTQCPQCCTEINTVRVSRLMRTQVSFTSTLPRKGYIIVCPECEGILSAELSGLL